MIEYIIDTDLMMNKIKNASWKLTLLVFVTDDVNFLPLGAKPFFRRNGQPVSE
jgi:hypothetical protein